MTKSSNFPTTPNAYIQNLIGDSDVFISKLSADLSRLLASTYLGGSDSDIGCSMFFCSDGSIYVAGQTESSDFPTVPNNYDISYNGNTDAFVSKLSDDLTKLLASTYLGGSSGEADYSMTVDSNGNIYLTGSTASSNFPTTSNVYDNSFNGGEDVFVSKLSNDLIKLLASTYLGGSEEDEGNFITINSDGNIYVTGWTRSSSFPTTKNTYDTSLGGSIYGDAFISNFNDTLSVSPPIVMTGPASILTPNSAKLNGIVNANDSSTKVWFEYGTKKGSYNNTSSTQTIDGSNDTKISIGISGLSVGTTYYYRIVAQNNLGTMYGNERTFIQEIQSPQSSSTSEQTTAQLPITYNLTGEWEGKVDNKPVTLSIAQDGNSLSGNIVYDTEFSKTNVTEQLSGKINNDKIVLKGTGYTAKGVTSFSLDTFSGTISSQDGDFIRGNHTDEAGHSGTWFVTKSKSPPHEKETLPKKTIQQITKFEKLLSDVKDADLFSTHSQVFPYRYDEVWDVINYHLKKEKENITQSDKETGIIVTDTIDFLFDYNSRMFNVIEKYYIFIERINEVSSKVNLKLITYYFSLVSGYKLNKDNWL